MIRLALINLLRQKARSLVTALGVAVAIGTLFLLLAFQRGYQNGLRSELGPARGAPYRSSQGLPLRLGIHRPARRELALLPEIRLPH